jgi:hypothetical protein
LSWQGLELRHYLTTLENIDNTAEKDNYLDNLNQNLTDNSTAKWGEFVLNQRNEKNQISSILWNQYTSNLLTNVDTQKTKTAMNFKSMVESQINLYSNNRKDSNDDSKCLSFNRLLALTSTGFVTIKVIEKIPLQINAKGYLGFVVKNKVVIENMNIEQSVSNFYEENVNNFTNNSNHRNNNNYNNNNNNQKNKNSEHVVNDLFVYHIDSVMKLRAENGYSSDADQNNEVLKQELNNIFTTIHLFLQKINEDSVKENSFQNTKLIPSSTMKYVTTIKNLQEYASLSLELYRVWLWIDRIEFEKKWNLLNCGIIDILKNEPVNKNNKESTEIKSNRLSNNNNDNNSNTEKTAQDPLFNVPVYTSTLRDDCREMCGWTKTNEDELLGKIFYFFFCFFLNLILFYSKR